MRRLSHVVATVTSVAVMTLAAGCGEDNPTPSAAPRSPSEAPSSPRPTPPSIPKAATLKTQAGAAEFVRHWVGVLNYAGESGDTDPLKSLSTADCIKCAALWDGIDGVYGAGGRIEGGGWTVIRTKQYAPTQNRFFVDAYIRSTPQRLQASEGADPQEFPGANERLRAFVLKPVPGGWQVAELDPTA